MAELADSESELARENESLYEKISIRNLDFFYGKSQALKGINLSLYAKKVTAVIGPSGCGKSTLLRVLNRMYDLYPGQRTTGEVLLDGENILSPTIDVNVLRSRIGMVFQRPTPFPMSIYENIAFGIRLYERPPRSELDGRVEFTLRSISTAETNDPHWHPLTQIKAPAAVESNHARVHSFDEEHAS